MTRIALFMREMQRDPKKVAECAVINLAALSLILGLIAFMGYSGLIKMSSGAISGLTFALISSLSLSLIIYNCFCCKEKRRPSDVRVESAYLCAAPTTIPGPQLVKARISSERRAALRDAQVAIQGQDAPGGSGTSGQRARSWSYESTDGGMPVGGAPRDRRSLLGNTSPSPTEQDESAVLEQERSQASTHAPFDFDCLTNPQGVRVQVAVGLMALAEGETSQPSDNHIFSGLSVRRPLKMNLGAQ